eukprot:2486126-Rhodomonas_salina.1
MEKRSKRVSAPSPTNIEDFEEPGCTGRAMALPGYPGTRGYPGGSTRVWVSRKSQHESCESPSLRKPRNGRIRN